MMKRTYGMQSLILLMLVAPACLFAREGWRLEADPAPWAGREEHNIEAFNGRLWVFNGSYGANSPPAAVRGIWSSANGKDWVKEGSEPWGGRSGAASLVFSDRMWMLGGGGFFTWDDVWSTDDGVNWTLETPAAPWEARRYHAAAVFDGRMWVLGGMGAPPTRTIFGDIWSSADGVNWTLETPNAPWGTRCIHAAVTFDNRLWVLGGSTGMHPQTVFNDVWSSTDGINWIQETSAAPWGPRLGHRVEAYNGRLWIVGGGDGVSLQGIWKDVWSSEDGINWHQQAVNVPWQGRAMFDSAVFNGRLWLAGGRNNISAYNNDVWSYGFHISPDVLPDGVIGEPYSAALEVREGDGPYLWEFVGVNMPPGLSFGSSTSETLPITGTPTQAGQFAFIARVTDSQNRTSEQPIIININPPPQPPPPPPDDDNTAAGSSGGNSGCSLARAGPSPILALLALVAALGAIVVGARFRVS